MSEKSNEDGNIQCPSCLALNPPEALHCMKCGSNLKEDAGRVRSDEGKLKTALAVNLAYGGVLYESVIDSNGFRSFIAFKDGKFSLQREVEKVEEGRTVRVSPANPNDYPYRPYRLTNGWEGEIDLKTLYKNVREFWHERLAAPPEYITLLTLSTFLSYLQDYVESVPYIWLVGDTESGKTRALQIMSILGFRAGYFADVPAADIYEYLGKDGEVTAGILLEDELEDIIQNDDKRRIWKAGYKRGSKVPRIIQSDRTGKRKQLFYNCYCFKMAASEKLPTGAKARGLLERVIILLMVYGIPKKTEIGEADYAEAELLRLQLLKLRLILYQKGLPKIEPILVIDDDGGKVKYELKGRDGEMWLPFLRIAKLIGCLEEAEKTVVFFFKERVKRRRETLEGYLARVLYEFYKQDPSRLEFSIDEIIGRLVEVVNGEVEDNRIKSEVLDEEVTKQKIGHRLREAFKGERILKRVEGRVERRWRFKKEELEMMFKKYFVTDVTELPTLEGVKVLTSMENLMEKTAGKDVVKPSKVGYIGYSVTRETLNVLQSELKNYAEIYSLAVFKILKNRNALNAEELHKTVYELFNNSELKDELRKEFDGLKLSKPVGKMLIKLREGYLERIMFKINFDGLTELYEKISALKAEASKQSEECINCTFFRTPQCSERNYDIVPPFARPCERFFEKPKPDLTLEEKIMFSKRISEKIKIDDFVEKGLFLKIIGRIFYDINVEEFYDYLKKKSSIVERDDGWFRWIQ